MADTWSLEIIKGANPGRIFPIEPGDSVLGNGIKNDPGIDLAQQEGTSLRKMAERQARLQNTPEGLALHDLDSPGGTFVNRQRLLAGQVRRLAPGDILQLGGVQLKVVQTSSRPTEQPTKPPSQQPTGPQANTSIGPLKFPYRFADGTVCKTWDDFLNVSTRSWTTLRAELASGRIDQFLRSQGYPNLESPASPTLNTDERLDAWLTALPTTTAAEPEIDVHPKLFRLRAVAGGGTTRLKLQVTNVGYRLLRSTIQIEPASKLTIGIASEWTTRPFLTSEQTEIPLDVTMPETVSSPISAFFRVLSNGGERRVEVRVEPSLGTKTPIDVHPGVSNVPLLDLPPWLVGWSWQGRVVMASLSGLAIRGFIAAIDLFSGGSSPHFQLRALIFLMGLLGAVIGVRYGSRREGLSVGLTTGFATAMVGIFLAALFNALRQTLDTSLGASAVWQCLVWAGIGALLGAASLVRFPTQTRSASTIEVS